MGITYMDCSIYKYGTKYKIVYLNRYVGEHFKEFNNSEVEKIGEKYLNNICRARSKILSLGMCNEWDYFCTFTLDKNKYNRFDLNKWKNDFSQYIRNQRRLTGEDIAYLLIPEIHENGAWHMHGLIRGFSWNKLSKFDRKIHPLKLVNAGYRFHEGISKKFGFNSFGKLKNVDAASKYILKYVTKGMASTNISLGNHLYYSSKGLKDPELIQSGVVVSYLTKLDFQNEFMSTSWVSATDIEELKGQLI